MANTKWKERMNRRRAEKQETSDREESSREVFTDELAITDEKDYIKENREETAPFDVNFSELLESTAIEKNEESYMKPENIQKSEYTKRVDETRKNMERLRSHSVISQSKREEDKQNYKILRIGIIMDGTFSFTTVYPKIYYVMEKLLQGLKSAKEEYKGVKIEYALTIFHDEPEVVCFADGNYFTQSESELKAILENMSFYGGSSDGFENLYEAVNQQLYILNDSEEAKTADKGLIMFTDSLPADDLMPNFTSGEPGKYGNYTNYGLRFANIYAHTDEFKPKFKIVDGYGNPSTNIRNMGIYSSLKTLLERDTLETVDEVQRIIEKILNQASIGMS